MKNVIPILLFFITSLSYSQDLIIEFNVRGINKGTMDVSVDDGVNKLRIAKIPALTPLGVIKYFQNEGYKVDIRTPQYLNILDEKYILFLYKIGKGKE